MKPKTLEHLQYFVGKVCSIVSTSMNRSFDEKVSREHFVVMIQQVDSDGIWGIHPYNSELVSFFCLEHVISIHQEYVLDPSNPEHAEMMREYEEKTGQKITSDLHKTEEKPVAKPLLSVLQEKPPTPSKPSVGDATFVDVDNLERLAENTKRAFDHYDEFSR